MGKRKNAPRAIGSTEATNKTDKPEQAENRDGSEAGIEQAAEPLPGVPSPDLVPAQRVAAEDGPAQAETPRPQPEPIDLSADLPITAAAGDVISVSFARAAADPAARSDRAAGRRSAIAAYLRARRLLPLAATVAIAVMVGALVGAFGSAGMSRLMASDDTSQAASRDMQETIAKIGANLTALKNDMANSARSTSAQFARLGERLDRADHALAESSGKVARLTESLERRVAAAPTATGDRLVTGSIPAGPPPQISAPASRPAGQAIVEGWTLRSVANGAAVIQGRIGLVEVEPGDSLPALGRIEAIRRLDGRWVVVTTRGLIIAR